VARRQWAPVHSVVVACVLSVSLGAAMAWGVGGGWGVVGCVVVGGRVSVRQVCEPNGNSTKTQ